MNNNSSHYRSPSEKLLRRPGTTAALLVALLVLTSACGGGAESVEGVSVVATTSILGDVAKAVVGDDGQVDVLIPRGVDPHDYLPSSRQVADLAGADLIIANGLNLEAGLADVLRSTVNDGVPVLWVGELLDPLPFGEDVHAHDGLDPHVWLDPLRMADAALLIAGELATTTGTSGWTERAKTYADEMAAADAAIVEILAPIPDGDRVLVTGHDAFGYFADRYGFRVLDTVIPGGSTQAEPSSAEMAGLVEMIETTGVPAIFMDIAGSTALADAIAAEFDGAVSVVSLHTGAIGEPGSGAETLVDMLLSNARAIAEALS